MPGSPSSVVPVSGAATSLPPVTSPPPDTAGESAELHFTSQHKTMCHPFPLPIDIVEALNHQLDAQWRDFGTFLHVDYQVMQTITLHNRRVGDCMLELLEKWTSNQAGTGPLPRTWQTVVDAVKETGFRILAENLAHKHGAYHAEPVKGEFSRCLYGQTSSWMALIAWLLQYAMVILFMHVFIPL